MKFTTVAAPDGLMYVGPRVPVSCLYSARAIVHAFARQVAQYAARQIVVGCKAFWNWF